VTATLPPLDDEGFLRDPAAWTPAIAEALAAREGIALTPAHWQILHLLRAFYAHYEAAPAMRALVNYVRRELGAELGSSLYLLKLFPGSPAKLGSKIAGLPKPENCL
jgi:tRNA 2-thiouridine synthesizing protein E